MAAPNTATGTTRITSYADEDLHEPSKTGNENITNQADSSGNDGSVPHTHHHESQDDHEQQQDVRVNLQPMNILIVGPTGSGKSTLVNSVFGLKVAETKEGVAAQDHDKIADEHDHPVPTQQGQVQISLYDTKGLGDPSISYKEYFKQFASKCKGIKFDLVLICLKITERIDYGTIQAINHFAKMFGENFWESSIFLLTFANKFDYLNRDRDECPRSAQDGESTEQLDARIRQYLSGLLNNRKEETRECLKTCLQINKLRPDVLDDIPFCPVGWIREGHRNEDKHLSATDDWLCDLMKVWETRCQKGTKFTMSKVTEAIMLGGTAGVVVGTIVGGIVGGAVGTGVLPIVGTVVGISIGAVTGGVIGTGVGSTVTGTATAIAENKLNTTEK